MSFRLRTVTKPVTFTEFSENVDLIMKIRNRKLCLREIMANVRYNSSHSENFRKHVALFGEGVRIIGAYRSRISQLKLSSLYCYQHNISFYFRFGRDVYRGCLHRRCAVICCVNRLSGSAEFSDWDSSLSWHHVSCYLWIAGSNRQGHTECVRDQWGYACKWLTA